MQLRTAAFCAALRKAGSNALKIHGKIRLIRRHNKQQFMTAKYGSAQLSVHRALQRLRLLDLHHRPAAADGMEEGNINFAGFLNG
jgi:hypothetical protein